MALAQGQSVVWVCGALGVMGEACCGSRGEFGGLRVVLARRLRAVGGTETRGQRGAVVNVAVANRILREAAEGNF